MKIEKKYILKELESIKNTFSTTADLSEYQRRMWENACFIDIKNQFEDVFKQQALIKKKILDDIESWFKSNNLYTMVEILDRDLNEVLQIIKSEFGDLENEK